MRQSTARGWLWRPVLSAAVVFAFLFAPDHSLHAQTTQATLVVSDFGSNELTSFNTSLGTLGNSTGTQVATASSGAAAGEGQACLVSSVSEIFVSDLGVKIGTYSVPSLTALVTTYFTVPNAQFTSLSLNPSAPLPGARTGPVLYAADQANSMIWAFDASTQGSTPIYSVYVTPAPGQTQGVHDVLWDPYNQTLYATVYQGTASPTSNAVVVYAYTNLLVKKLPN
jgi:hypothetical protein